MMRFGFLMSLGLAVLPSCSSSTTPSNGNASKGEMSANQGTGGSATTVDGATADGKDFVASADTFQCIQRGTKIRNFYLVNELGHLSDAVAVANSTSGGTYPVGTIIQLIPTEAMVKRGPGFNSATNDWEFFSLSVSGKSTQILARGTADVVNQFGGNCFNCHAKAAPQFDFVCEETHGCDPLPLTPSLIQTVQESDSRCP